MTEGVTANVTVNLGTGKDYTVVVYNKSPFDNSDAVYFTKKKVSDASVTNLKLSVPNYLTKIYVSVFDSNNHSRSKWVDLTSDAVDVIFGTAMEGSFSRTRAGNVGADYNATSEGINANANEWADPSPGKTFGGWIVPDPLTTEQKAVVKAYFQSVPNLTYEDPQWRHFFVQQVYKGGTDPGDNSNEAPTSADGHEYSSDNMNLMTVGHDELHINNFNTGSYNGQAIKIDGVDVEGSLNEDGSVNVLDSGYTANDYAEHHHPDQIMLMVNIDDTECFGYHNSACSKQKNDKAALVSWDTIRTWANNRGLNGDCLDDGWNRSFLGFDFELLSLDESYAKDGDNIINAKFNDGQLSGVQYVWDGTKVMKRGSASDDVIEDAGGEVDLTSAFSHCYNGSVTNDENGIVFVSNSYGGLQAYNNFDGIASNWSAYDKFVIDFAEETPNESRIDLYGAGSFTIAKGTTQFVLDIKGKNYNVSGGTLVSDPAGTFKISKIYLVAGGAAPSTPAIEYYESEYFIINDDMLPFLRENDNMYGGEKLTLADDSMKITKDGKTCINLVKFAELVNDGYLPRKDTNLRTWYRWRGGDGYFSDWIVTLTKANREDEEEYHEEGTEDTPLVYTYAFEDTFMGDYDMNDVVVQVWEDEDDSSKLNVKLCCTGASYELYLFLGDQKIFGSEVHAVFGGSAPKFINTGTGEKFQTKAAVTTQINKPDDYDPDTADFWIQSPAGDIHVGQHGDTRQIGNAPYGVMIPKAWAWPNEWVPVNEAYKKFSNWAADKDVDKDWYDYPEEGKTRTK